MKKLFSFVLLAVCLCLLLCGCKKMKAESTDPIDDGRFDLEYSQTNNFGGKILIIRDSETGTKYLFVQNGYGGGLTKLE